MYGESASSSGDVLLVKIREHLAGLYDPLFYNLENMKTTKRVLAFVVGLTGLAGLKGIPTNPAESLGSYIGRKIFAAMAVYLVAYGVGFFPRPKKSQHNDSDGS